MLLLIIFYHFFGNIQENTDATAWIVTYISYRCVNKIFENGHERE